ncbi:MAG: glycine cleavage system protein [Thermoleophilia bacterium]|nr:glycine cleavage system protein [Thermoleophilia bacterium]
MCEDGDMSGTDTHVAPLDAAATRAALADGAVARWWQVTAFLEVSGPDAATLLDGICTQAVQRIEPGHAALGLFLDGKAKIIAPTLIHRLPDAPWTNERRPDEPAIDGGTYLLETLPELVEPLRAHISRYRLRSRATIAASSLSSIAVAGPEAAELVGSLPATDGSWTSVAGQAAPTHAFLGSAEACAELVRGPLAALLAEPDATESHRIDAGIPSLHDLLPGRMPAEVGGMVAVALDAGCYLGQEPVARLHFRGHPNRTLRRLESTDPIVVARAVESETVGEEDAPFELRRIDAAAGRASGRLTTWATRPDGSIAALAVLRREIEQDELLQLPDTATSLRVLDASPAAE